MPDKYFIGITTWGSLTYAGRIQDNLTTRSPNLKKRIRVQCVCGQRLTIPLYYVTRHHNPKTHCGCLAKSIKTHHKREYGIWSMMHVRTENPDHVSFACYGGRGIRVCAEWNKSAPDGRGFERFLEFVGPAPSTSHSIDRVDNDLGYQPYQPNGERQVRWATAIEQRANQRKANAPASATASPLPPYPPPLQPSSPQSR